MPMGKFLLYTTAGSAVWNTVLLTIGNMVGENWVNMITIFEQYSHITLAVLAIIFILGCLLFYWKKTNKFIFKRKVYYIEDSSMD